MPFVQRDSSGQIVAVKSLPSIDGQEFLDKEDPALAKAALAVGRVKSEAYHRIVAVVPEWMQRNMTARSVAFDHIATGRMIKDDGTFEDARDLNEGEKLQLIAIRKTWEWIEAVRTASDLIEADAENLTPDAIKDDPRWPANPEL